MARSRFNGKLLCLCLLPCVMVSHLLVYIMVSIFVAVSYSPPPPQLPLHFIATGASENSGVLASHPIRPFWNLRLEEGALWNSLQHIWDREHNPILRGNGTGSKGQSLDSIPSHETRKTADCGRDQTWASHLHDFNTLPDQMKDFVLSMHCRHYPILVNQPNLCAGQDSETETPFLLMAIKSQVGNFENRQAIRETWGRTGWVQGDTGGKAWLIRTVFLLARQDTETGPHPDLGALLELESNTHKDILQWDFRDTFFNLTLKDLLFWEWFSKHCPHVHFIFKGDDDVFVRTRALLDYLNQHRATVQKMYENKTNGQDHFLIGDVIANAWPNRQPGTKYYIPESFYKGTYPAYAGGGGVVYTGALAMHLLEVSHWVSLFPIDDVYLGMCLHRLGVSPTHHSGFLTFDLPADLREKPCAYRNVLLVHKRTPKEMLTLWKELQVPAQEC
ncbi:N-acetyllactosaminide beta-1,3-N-acetylglucosaminyltransferase 2-like [Myxocyprinus asiaticus]|uniref:N-acetyllactosaminide beta-1,3-N-acetylglucosaminyltransferase 2-like n=1 Tax=Myxocyprinus asiaticus TaxID=70543 RepID=UPI002222DA13|nr:N-acetyllactosaminide beta-1,3-N-acetylglucosaminyltransferase 2-like [Myxocyprinus asiaticus]